MFFRPQKIAEEPNGPSKFFEFFVNEAYTSEEGGR